MYEDIVKKYGRKFKYLCWDYEKYHDAKREELYQQVLLNIYVALDDFKGESSPYTYAYRVAINTCCNHVGKEKHESKQSLDYDFSLAGYEFKYEAMFDYKIMIEFASTFKRIDREIIFMYLLGGKHNFIAEVLGLTETNISSKLNRLKKKIETHMNKGMSDEK